MPTVPSPPPLGTVGSMGEYDDFMQAQKPTPTSILLAAATMHNQGRLVGSGDHIGFGGSMPNMGKRTSTGAPAGRSMPVRGRRR